MQVAIYTTVYSHNIYSKLSYFGTITTTPQQTFTCSNSTIQTLEECVKYVNNKTQDRLRLTSFWCLYC